MGDQHHNDNSRLVYVTCGNDTSIFEVDSNFENGLGASANNEETMHLHLKDKCALHKDRCYRNQKPKQPTDFETGLGASAPYNDEDDWKRECDNRDYTDKKDKNGRNKTDWSKIYPYDCTMAPNNDKKDKNGRNKTDWSPKFPYHECDRTYNDKKDNNGRNKTDWSKIYPYDCTMAPNNDKKDRNCRNKSTKPTDKPPCHRYFPYHECDRTYNDKKDNNGRNKTDWSKIYPYDCTMAPNNDKKDRNCRNKSTKPTDKPPCHRYDECSKPDYSETASTTSTASTMKSSVKMGRNKCEPCPHVKPCRSRELRGGILYTDCHCLRRNGLQYDCRRSGCQRSPECEIRPAPTCEPSRQACIRHRTNPHAEPLTVICDQQPH